MKNAIRPAKKFWRSACVALAVGLGVAAPAAAQYGAVLGDSGLGPKDIEIALAAAESLYAKAGVAVGDETLWSNPDTGAVGFVEVMAVEEDGRCVAVKHLVRASRNAPVKRYGSRRCRSADGSWLIAPKQ